MKYTIAHVTHEAVEKIGGIGTVLEGLITSPIYKDQVQRSILVGPCSVHHQVDPLKRLGEHGTVLYSGVDQIDELGLARKLHPIEWAFDVNLVYGKRSYVIPGTDLTGEADVLLIDVFKANNDRLGVFKYRLAETFGLESSRYDNEWGYEEYIRLAEPAFYGLRALLSDDELPCVLFSHEFMGMPAALKCVMDGGEDFRTIFHAHECATARSLVEGHSGHDTMFYNAMAKANEQGKYADDLFGSQDHMFRHALVSRAHLCDGVIAVGDDTAREMHFLGKQFDKHQIDLVYNGVPSEKCTLKSKQKARKMLAEYADKLIGFEPDVLMTHVMRPVTSKSVWRDLDTCSELETKFAESDMTGVLFILTSAGGTRRLQDVRAMESEYGWPRNHREGYPDLVGPEVWMSQIIDEFNANHDRIQAVLVNQFGWDASAIGERLPEGMHIGHLREAADLEFGMACYEPFGISPLEPLCYGAICCISNVCGCAGFTNLVSDGKPEPNVCIADYTQLEGDMSLEQILSMDASVREGVERAVAADLAERIFKHLPRDDTDRKMLIKRGQQLAADMGWDAVCEQKLMPMLNRIIGNEDSPRRATEKQRA